MYKFNFFFDTKGYNYISRMVTVYSVFPTGAEVCYSLQAAGAARSGRKCW